jgi:hypothetical protein
MNNPSPSALPFADVIPPELVADTRAVLDLLTTGKPLDEQTRDRIRREAERVGDEIRRTHGVLDIGVPAIRELRDA